MSAGLMMRFGAAAAASVVGAYNVPRDNARDGSNDAAGAGTPAGATATAAGTAPVMILAGGTGGHIFPGIAVARALARRGVPVVWLGSSHGLETKLVPAAGIRLRTIGVTGLRGKGAAGWALAPFRLGRALWQALRVLREEAPRSVLSFGGFAAGPGGMAAWVLRRPLLVHEQNRIPGLTNRTLARVAARTMAGFPDSFGAQGGEWVGNPVRSEIAALSPPAVRFAGRDGAPRVLVLGGSQGARALNAAVPLALAQAGVHAEVRHQCGERLREHAERAYRDAGIAASVEPFIDDMAAAYAWADLVVCRAGALTLAELAAAGCGALLVPFPHAVDDHQTRNAAFFVERHAAELLPEGADLAQRLGTRLAALLPQREQLLAMAEAARRLHSEDAADVVARACIEEGQR